MRGALVQIGFLSLFNLIGGMVAGRSVRLGIRQGWSCNLLGGITWGIFFGGIPLFFGLTTFAETGTILPLVIQLLVFAGSFLVVVLIPDWILEAFNFQAFLPILFGGVFMVVGVVAFLALAGDSILPALLFLAAFGGFGGFLFVTSALKALRG